MKLIYVYVCVCIEIQRRTIQDLERRHSAIILFKLKLLDFFITSLIFFTRLSTLFHVTRQFLNFCKTQSVSIPVQYSKYCLLFHKVYMDFVQ